MKYRQVINPITGQFNLIPDISILNFKPAVDTYENLPITGNTKGDARFVRDTGHLYAWGIEASEGQLTDWIDIGDVIDISWESLEGKPASPPAEIDDAANLKHEHINKDVLDNIEEAFTTAEKTKLDTIEENAVSLNTVKTDAEIADAIEKKHTQNTDTKLDEGGENEVNASDIKTAIGLKHEHINKEILDNTEEAFTKDLKNKLDNIEENAVSLETVKLDEEILDAINKKHTQNTDTILKTSTGELINDGLLKSPLILDAEIGCNSIFLRPSSTKDPQRKFYISVGEYIGDNSVFCIGWNAVAHGGPTDPTEPSLSFSIESNYCNLFEVHWRHYWYEGETLNFREPGSMLLQRFGKHKSSWQFRDSLGISDYSEENYIPIFSADKDGVGCYQPLDVITNEDELIARFHRYGYAGFLEIIRREEDGNNTIRLKSVAHIGYDYLANLIFDARQFRFYTPIGSQEEENFYFDGGWIIFRNYDTNVDIAAIVNKPNLVGLGYNITRKYGMDWKVVNEEKRSTLIYLNDHEIRLEGTLTPGGSDWVRMLHMDLVNDKFLIPHSTMKVGIRTDNPTEALDVNGNINIKGLLKTNGEEGTEGQVLTRIEDGIAWQDPTGVAFPLISPDGLDGTTVLRGTFGEGWIEPNLGTGTRLLWYPRKAAFRAGYLDAEHWWYWSDFAIGEGSVAMGINVRAGWRCSVAMGEKARSEGYSIALGHNVYAYISSVAIGDEIFSGGYSVAIGVTATAFTVYSIAIGTQVSAVGFVSTVIGKLSNAIGSYSLAMGVNSNAFGNSSFAIGEKLFAMKEGSFVIGRGSPEHWLANDIPNSLAVGFNSNIPTLFVGPSAGVGTFGKVGIGTTEPESTLDVNGDVKVRGILETNKIGYDIISEPFSFAIGNNVKADGPHVIGIGYDIYCPVFDAIGIGKNIDFWDQKTIALGFDIVAKGIGFIAFGSNIQGDYWSRNSIAIGHNVDVDKERAIAIGNDVKTYGYESIAIGANAKTDTAWSCAIGVNIVAEQEGSFVIGRGLNEETPLVNSICDSLIVGFRSDVPTLFVGGGPGGGGSTGRVGIGGVTDPKGKLHVEGSIATAISEVTEEEYILTELDSIILVDASVNSIIINLPLANEAKGRMYTIKRIDNELDNTVTIVAPEGETIDGESTQQLQSQYQIIRIVSNGSNWFII